METNIVFIVSKLQIKNPSIKLVFYDLSGMMLNTNEFKGSFKELYRERDLNPRPTDYDSDALTS
jgi:hypothetical protein